MLASEIITNFKEYTYNDILVDLYEDDSLLEYQNQRYINAVEKFIELYGDQEVEIISTPGRSEVCGNHTDHQNGRVVAAAINLDGIAVVTKSLNIKVLSDNFDIPEINVYDTDKKDDEEGTSAGLIRGITAKFMELGYRVGGFKAFITSDVLVGSGISSSASFEVMIGAILSNLYNDGKVDPVEIAKIGQYSENVYFGKPCGLMDQCACSVGGLITIDFKDEPDVKALDVDFSKYGYSLCIIDTKGHHADLTDEYAAVPKEMKDVASYFGKNVLREVDEEQFYANINVLREKYGDRAVLRSIHLFNENRRVGNLVDALENSNFDTFLKIIKESGDSSYKYLQNVYTTKDVKNQSMSMALALSDHFLNVHGVSRVHGGGFAGTIQAFCENDYVLTYKEQMEKVFGEGSCHVLKIRKYGAKKVL